MSDRIQRNMQRDKPMTALSVRVPVHVVDDLKEVASAFDFSSDEALVRAYISHGLRQHLSELEARRVKENAVEEFSQRLLAHGVSVQTLEQAAAEMRASG